jgi:hypothetical protein
MGAAAEFVNMSRGYIHLMNVIDRDHHARTKANIVIVHIHLLVEDVVLINGPGFPRHASCFDGNVTDAKKRTCSADAHARTLDQSILGERNVVVAIFQKVGGRDSRFKTRNE